MFTPDNSIASFKAFIVNEDSTGAAETILRWLRESPEFARQQILRSGAYKVQWVPLLCAWATQQQDLNVDIVLSCPHFRIPVPRPQSAQNALKMSGNISESGREKLKDYYGYNVHFRRWQLFCDYISDTSVIKIADPNQQMALQNCLSELLCSTYQKISPGQLQELSVYVSSLDLVFKSFGFEVTVKNGKEEDFFVSRVGLEGSVEMETDKKEAAFLVGEGKAAAKLPWEVVPGTSHELCLFGFATYVARTTAEDVFSTGELINLLDIRKPNTFKRKTCAASELVKSLLKCDGGIDSVAANIKSKLTDRKVGPDDAVNLWAAVMQACHYSVSEQRAFSFVMSSRMIFYIRLEVENENDRCWISISDGTGVGPEGYLKELISLLSHAAKEDKMSVRNQRKWQRSLCPHGNNERDGNSNKSGTPARESESPSEKSPPTTSRELPVFIAQPMDVSSHAERSEEKHIVRAISADEPDFADASLATDKYGVIPYFDQIRKTLGGLGYGRAGTVTFIEWRGKEAALKKFISRPELEDDRYFYDLYEHELMVLDELRPLWGKYVPALLFHNPWRTCPMVGLQVGKPIEEDDIFKWSQEDKEKLKETVAKVKGLGWVQEDLRGNNFVRLVDPDGIERIAMVDFESMVRREDSETTSSC